jgi:hypothetical protein
MSDVPPLPISSPPLPIDNIEESTTVSGSIPIRSLTRGETVALAPKNTINTVAGAPGTQAAAQYNGYISPGAIPLPKPNENVQAFVDAQNASPTNIAPSAPAVEKQTDYVDEIYQITSTSTAHDVWRIFDRKRTCFNRSLWTILWLTCFSLYITYFVAQLLQFLSRPSSTLVEAVMESPMAFPSVAICLSTTNASMIRQFFQEPVSGGGLTLGVRCTFGFSATTTGSALNGQDCRSTARKEWSDYPFGVSPTACLRFNAEGEYVANLPGTTMTFIVNVPGLANSIATANFQLLDPKDSVHPLLSNLIDVSSATKVLFQKSTSSQLDSCTNDAGGQRTCAIKAEQKCVETVCGCTYPDPYSPEDLPGSCAAKLQRGECVYGRPIYQCPGKINQLCALEDICSPKNIFAQCPYPSCFTMAFPFSASTNQLPSQFQGTGIFVMSVVLRSVDVNTMVEVRGMTLLDFFGSIGGMMGLLLGFSVVRRMRKSQCRD